ncbi:DUF6153 family protein [Kribbella sp. WER1]
MAGRIHDCGARLLRVLGVLTVVAGVFAMHGLTSDHDAAMVMPGTVVMEHPAEVHVTAADEMPGMGGACVGVLTGLVLLLSVLLGLRSLLVWRAVAVPVYRVARALGERSPPRVVLSSLGVLRI